MKCCSVLRPLLAAAALACAMASAEEPVIISEFLAVNNSTLVDEEGNPSPWIEIFNSGEPADLAGWYLTDDAQALTKWKFPQAPVDRNSFFVVFASGKDRRIPGSPLHANFELKDEGGYLALVKPDGKTIASSFTFDHQSPDTSLGVSMRIDPGWMITNQSLGKVFVPADGSLSTQWTAVSFDDSAWTPATNGIGFEGGTGASGPGIPADSEADFSGVQGARNWLYGYYSRDLDSDLSYGANDFVPFPNDATQAWGVFNYWNAAVNEWDFPPANPPWTAIGMRRTHPNGRLNNVLEQWTIRRWTSPVNGTVHLSFAGAKMDAGGDGTTTYLFQNGMLLYSNTIAGGDTVGFAAEWEALPVHAGDVLDFVLTPWGVGAAVAQDPHDGTSHVIRIEKGIDLAGHFQTDVGTLMQNRSASIYFRLPFQVEDPATTSPLQFRLQWNDGFIAYLNGQPVATNNAAGNSWNSTSAASRPNSQSREFVPVDLSAFQSLLQKGKNVLALHGLNSSAADNDFLLSAQLQAPRWIIDAGAPVYFSRPTPAAINSSLAVPPASPVRLTLGSGPPTAALFWNSEPGRRYRVEYRDRLEDSPWRWLGDFNADSESGFMTDPDASGRARRFYRVVVLE